MISYKKVFKIDLILLLPWDKFLTPMNGTRKKNGFNLKVPDEVFRHRYISNRHPLTVAFNLTVHKTSNIFTENPPQKQKLHAFRRFSDCQFVSSRILSNELRQTWVATKSNRNGCLAEQYKSVSLNRTRELLHSSFCFYSYTDNLSKTTTRTLSWPFSFILMSVNLIFAL